jgi:broad specificity phosphatase PhoE
MNTFLLARHGETVNNKLKRLSGWIDTPLTEKGLVPTENVVQKLRTKEIDVLYSSDLGRAVSTAEFIGKAINYTDPIIQLPGLREVNYGSAANMLSVEAYKLYPQLDRDTHFTPPEGESLDQMQQRVLDAVHSINHKYTDRTILLVAHSGVMAALEASYLHTDFGQQNISEAYDHDVLCEFTLDQNQVASFSKY